ncbi:MAG: ATP-binding protein [Magnetococcus sp. XQGC-1]
MTGVAAIHEGGQVTANRTGWDEKEMDGLQRSPADESGEKREPAAPWRLLFQDASDGILVVNLRTHRFVMANRAICRQLGHDHDALLNMGVDNIHPAEALPRIYRELASSARGDTKLHNNIPLLCKDGRIWLADVAVAAIEWEGEPCLVGFFRDITQRVLRENENHLRAERYKALLEMPALDGENVARIVGYTLEKMVQLTGSRHGFLGLMQQEGAEMLLQGWSGDGELRPEGTDQSRLYPLHGGEIWEDLLRHRQSWVENDPVALVGKKSWLPEDRPIARLIGHPVVEGEQTVLVAIAVNKGSDYTEEDLRTISLLSLAMHQNIKQHRLEEGLRQARKMEAIGRLASGVAHDFNNILSIILGNIELATMNLHDVELVLVDMRTAALRGRDMVRQLLSLGGGSRSRETLFDPVPAIREVTKLMRSVLPSAIELVEKMPEEGGQICVDPTRFHQILLNLCTNAGQAMRERGGVLEVAQSRASLKGYEATLLGVAAGEYVRISVRDSGPGIPRALQERIFDPFFSTKGDGQGSGLGLSVVQWAVKNCSGAIRLESEPGQGSTFTVFIPLAEAREEQPTTVVAGPTLSVSRGRTVLFVEDEPALMSLGVRMLQELGYAAVGKTDPHQALELFLAQPDGFAAVITDYAMPGLTGEALAERIHAIRPALPIFLSTGLHREVGGAQGVVSAFAGTLFKPIALAELAMAMKRIA